MFTILSIFQGYIWVLDRRNGKTLDVCTAHDCAIVNIFTLGNYKFITVSEKSASIIWSYYEFNLKKVVFFLLFFVYLIKFSKGFF